MHDQGDAATHARRALLLLLGWLPGLCGAAPGSYLEGGFLWHQDTDATDGVANRGDSQIGYRAALQIAGSGSPVAGFVDYDNTDQLEQFSVGALYAASRPANFAPFAGASIEFEDMTDKKGYGLRAGLRWRPAALLTVLPELRHVALFEAQTSFRTTLLARISRRWEGELSAQLGEDPRYTLGLRYRWAGPRGWIVSR